MDGKFFANSLTLVLFCTCTFLHYRNSAIPACLLAKPSIVAFVHSIKFFSLMGASLEILTLV